LRGFDPEDGRDMFLRNVGFLSTDYTGYIPEDRSLHNHRCENVKKLAEFFHFSKFRCCAGYEGLTGNWAVVHPSARQSIAEGSKLKSMKYFCMKYHQFRS
jgi:hypothetical protein